MKTLDRAFEVMADAPGGVKKIRELILQLAVQGKLVEQDPNDEPASVLLEKIAKEKTRLVKEGKIRKQKELPLVSDDEKPYDLPAGWEWVRLEQITSYIQRGKGPKYVEKSPFPVISQKCIQWSGFDISKARFIDPNSLSAYEEYRFLQTGDLLWNSTGTGTVGRVNVYESEKVPFEKVVVDSHVTVIRPVFADSRFQGFWIASPRVQDEINGIASGSTNQIELNTSTVIAHITPLPPLAEQKRIVAKVDQLMALCDKLEERKKVQEARRVAMNASALDSLTTASNPKEFDASWRRIRDNFSLLYDRAETVKALRSTILQLAVQGKLVPQDPKDGPVEGLKVHEAPGEKAHFDIPENWRWIAFADLGEIRGGGTPSKNRPEFWTGPIPWVSPKDMKKDYVASAQMSISGEAIEESSAKIIRTGSLLFVVRGMILSHSFPVALSVAPVTINQDMKAIELFKSEMGEYLLRAMKGLRGNMLSQVERSSHGTCRLDSSDYKAFLIPTPPPAEQKRIVAKVDQLMSLCNRLEASLTTSRDKAASLAASVVNSMGAA